MAGNNAIQILRVANLASTANASQIPLDGQPFYDKATRKLFIGDGTNILANYRSLDKGVVAGGLNAPWGSVLNVAGNMGISAPNVRYSYDNASYPQHINVHFPGSLDGESDITLSTDSAPTFCLNTTGIGEFVWQTVPLFINANGYNNDAITLTSSSSSNIVVNAGKSLNLSAASGDINLNSNNIKLNTNVFDVYSNKNVSIKFSPYASGFNMYFTANPANYLSFTGGSTNIISTSMNLISYSATKINASTFLSLYSSGSLQINGSNTSIIGRSNLSLKKGSYTYSLPNASGGIGIIQVFSSSVYDEQSVSSYINGRGIMKVYGNGNISVGSSISRAGTVYKPFKCFCEIIVDSISSSGFANGYASFVNTSNNNVEVYTLDSSYGSNISFTGMYTVIYC